MLVMRHARPGESELLSRWRFDTAAWLADAFGSDQWAEPGDPVELEARIAAGETFMVDEIPGDADEPIATVTMNSTPWPGLWTEEELRQPVRYVHKLIVPRSKARPGVGAVLLDWGGDKAACDGAEWLRLDCWTSNERLHKYYLRHGFEHVRTVADDVSGAPFQRPARRAACPPDWCWL